jgi:hypothetical protein
MIGDWRSAASANVSSALIPANCPLRITLTGGMLPLTMKRKDELEPVA